MKNKIKYLHHKEYIHMKCCLDDLCDVLLRIDFIDYLEIMKKYPMTHELSFFQRIGFFFYHLDFFIYELDLEVLRKAFDSMRVTYQRLIELDADEALLNDYAYILSCLQKSMIKKGHLD